MISQSHNGAASYYLQDGQGSTRTLTNSTGNVTDTLRHALSGSQGGAYDYTAFGEIFNQTGTTANSYLYTGQQFDDASGLYSLRARFYNPSIGRFLSQDTYPYNFNNPIELNRYGYAANRPINLNDPSGNQAFFEYAVGALKGAALGAIGGAISTYACGGSLAENMALGALFGAGFGMVAVYNLTFSLALGSAGGLLGYISAAEDIKAHGPALCNVMNAAFSLLGFVGGVYGGFSGGSFGPSLAGATDGGTVVISGTVIVVNQAAAAAAAELGILSLFSQAGGGGGGSDIWEYTDPKTGKEYKVGPHGKMPKPRNDNESHHGVMSKWMESLFGKKYNANKAPAVLMPEEDHHQTFSAYPDWRTRMAQQQGVGYHDLSRCSEFLSYFGGFGLSLIDKETKPHGSFQTDISCLYTAA